MFVTLSLVSGVYVCTLSPVVMTVVVEFVNGLLQSDVWEFSVSCDNVSEQQ